VVQELGQRCEMEVEDGPYTLDTVIYPDDGGLPIVLEVDGPSHFFRNHQDEPTGSTIFKHRLLAARRDRWRGVVSVSSAEWEQAAETKDPKGGQRALIIEKLQAVGLLL
jgi:hypothetical protein